MTNHRMSLRNPLVGAGIFLIVTLLLVGAHRAELIGADLEERGMGILIGLCFIVFGNYMPKTTDPPRREWCTSSRKQVLQRFSGWVFVIMGLGYSLVWLVLPVDQAGTVAKFLVAPAVVLVAGRAAWLYFTCKRVQQDIVADFEGAVATLEDCPFHEERAETEESTEKRHAGGDKAEDDNAPEDEFGHIRG